jgi:hypothetical protein
MYCSSAHPTHLANPAISLPHEASHQTEQLPSNYTLQTIPKSKHIPLHTEPLKMPRSAEIVNGKKHFTVLGTTPSFFLEPANVNRK